MRRFSRRPPVKLKPRNVRACGRPTALLARLTVSLRRVVMKWVIDSITRCPARALPT